MALGSWVRVLATLVFLLPVCVVFPGGPAAAGRAELVVEGRGDTGGYHLFVRRTGAWAELATLQPGGYADEAWIGNQCVADNGRTVVAVIAPWHLANNEAGMNAGGLAYAVDVASRAVRPLAAGVSLAYFNPGCGAGDLVAFTTYLGRAQRPTRVSVLHASTGAVVRSEIVHDQLTSTVPTSDGLVGVRGAELVRVEGGRAIPIERVGGPAFDVRARPGGGVEFEVFQGQEAQTRAPMAKLPQSALPAYTHLPARSFTSAASVRNTTAPACAVPRNRVFAQVRQPTSEQVRWAVHHAKSRTLGLRPPDPGQYRVHRQDGTTAPLEQGDPSVEFPAPETVPAQVMYGVLAQESNWSQASWRAVIGRAGNPLIANYYGAAPDDIYAIDYDKADCGYGIGQVTDRMRADSSGSPASQTRIAVDYATNIAAAQQILAQKFTQLAALGITMNGGDSRYLENWYGAIWAYNSGIHPIGEDTKGHGLGWANNPANPIYPPARHAFLHNGGDIYFEDASHPAFWPYQERVFGWMEVALWEPDGHRRYPGLLQREQPRTLTLPPFSTFCAPDVNACSYHQADPCPAVDASCWWPKPAAWVDCATLCVTDPDDGSPQTEPPGRTVSKVCDRTGLPDNAIVVDDVMLDQNPDRTNPNLVGCPTESRPWSRQGTFSITDSWGNPLTASSGADVDLHQVGGGFSGHMWATHTSGGFSSVAQVPANTPERAYEVRGAWQPVLPDSGIYEVRVFVPDLGATTKQATYLVAPRKSERTRGYRVTIDQNAYANQWVSLGHFLLSEAPVVTLGSITYRGDPSVGEAVAFDAMAFLPTDPATVERSGYVALGDSYSSGEGTVLYYPRDNFTDVMAGEHLDLPDGNLCHRSAYAYPILLAGQSTTLHTGPTIHLACSGSNLNDVAGIEYKISRSGHVYDLGEQAPDPIVRETSDSKSNPDYAGSKLYLEPATQVGQLRLANAKPKLITVTVGGNDVGFAQVVMDCVETYFAELFLSTKKGCRSHFSNGDHPDVISNRINGIKPRLVTAYKAIAQAVGDPLRVVVVNYPNIFRDPSEAHEACAFIESADRGWLREKTAELNRVIREAAAEAGVRIADVSTAFAGGDLCDKEGHFSAVELGIWPTTDYHLVDNYFHPSKEGYRRMAAALGNLV
ncbi:GDSL-type esterase/lipase family protein [Nonomuraea sp. NPDC050227]|uniref:GDSL-type esterase/lipase family protein n=1 Tax=Nonomuraea sp. NPDC050227 TaxID=3364360 RepID=UPI0037945695